MLIKFPIIFPLIYYLLIKSFPNYEMYVIFLTILLLAEPHFGATWPHFFSTFDNQYIKRNKFRLVYAPVFLIFFCIFGFFFFLKNYFHNIFGANMYPLIDMIGISKLYKRSINQINFEENIIYIFNILFFVIGFFRFFYPIIQDDYIFNLNVSILFLVLMSIIYSIYKFGLSSNSFTSLTGILIFYPICFVDTPVHAIIMGVTMHYSQYCVTFNIGLKKKLNENNEIKK